MGRDIYLDRIVLSTEEYQAWQRGAYLHFDAGIVNFDEACEASCVQLKDHYANEEEYNDALFEVEQAIYWEGHFSYDDRYGFEADNCDAIIEWDTVKVGDKYVVIRACCQ